MSRTKSAMWRMPLVGGGPELTGLSSSSLQASELALLQASELALERLDVRPHLRIAAAQNLDLPHGADDRRVVAVPEGPTELREAALQALLAQVHGDVPCEGHALVAILRQEVRRAELEVVADHPLDVLHAGLVRAGGGGRGQLGAREVHLDGAAEKGRLGRQADQRALELADVAADALRDEEADVVSQVDVLELRLLTHDGDAGLQLRGLDVGHEAPLEAADEALLHLVELLRVLVAGDDDLLAALVERVERVEELLLRLRLAGQEVDVVDEQQVALLPE